MAQSHPDIIESLLAHPGLYLGPQRDPEAADDDPSVARIVVNALPGGSGVSFDYEVLSPGGGRVHHEHAVLARTPGGLVLMTAHDHAEVATVLREGEPGSFVDADGTAPFPMAIHLATPEPGRLVYSWSYGRPGGELRTRDVGDLRAVGTAAG